MAQSAAGSPSNLTISISADTSKLRADLKLATAELRKFSAEEKRAADALTAGTGTKEIFLATSAQADLAAKRVTALSASYRDLTKAQAAAVPGAKSLGNSFSDVGEAFSNTLASARGLRAGLIGLVVAEVLGKIAQQVTDVTHAVVDLQRISKGTGFATSTIQAFQSALRTTGADAADASKILFSLSQSFNQARLQAERAGSALGTATQVLRGGAKDVASSFAVLRGGVDQTKTAAISMITVMKGGQGIVAPPEITDAASAYKALGINVTAYTQSLEDQDKLLIDVGEGLRKWREAGRVDVAQAIGTQILGKNYREVAQALDDISKPGNLAALRASLAATGQLISPEDIARVKEFRDIQEKIGDLAEGAQARSVIGALPALEGALQRQLALMKGLGQMPGELAQAWTEFGTSVTNTTAVAAGNVKQAWGDLVPWFANVASTIAANWNATMRTLAVPPFGDPSIPAMPLPAGRAAGGLISGPGSGTSDSILARLSNGEFVMRAAAVRQWGSGLLAAMNQAGSMALPRSSGRRGFAEGGLVAAGGGTPVHLHLGSRSFALSGASDVVGALVSEARFQQMRSAGVKPGWYGR